MLEVTSWVLNYGYISVWSYPRNDLGYSNVCNELPSAFVDAPKGSATTATTPTTATKPRIIFIKFLPLPEPEVVLPT